MIYGLGMLESGITFDFGQLVLDSEFARMIKHTVKGIPVDDGTLAGDLVAWMQISRKMKIDEAKQYVAKKLGIEGIDLTNEEVMRSIREGLGIGIITSVAGSPKGIRAKIKIAELLEIPINSVTLFNFLQIDGDSLLLVDLLLHLYQSRFYSPN